MRTQDIPTPLSALALPLLLILPRVADPDPFPPGVYTITFAAAEAGERFAGEWEMRFTEAGAVSVVKDGETFVEGRYVSTGRHVVMTDETGPIACTGPRTRTGIYGWTLQENELTMSAVEDECEGRRVMLTRGKWLKER